MSPLAIVIVFVIVTVRPRPNVELYMRGTKPSRVSFEKFDLWLSSDRPTRCFIRLKIVSRTNVDHHVQQTNLMNPKKLKTCMIMYI